MSERKTLTELVIDRTQWGKFSLKREDGAKCCLGFAAEACGVNLDAEGACCEGSQVCKAVVRSGSKAFPMGLPDSDRDILPEWLLDSEFCHLAAQANDWSPTQEERERLVQEVFAKKGCTVTFTG